MVIIGDVYMILKIDEYGWANIYIGDNGSIFTGRASYLRDTPLEMLNAFKLYVDNETIPVIKCDEEGSEFLIIVDEYATYIISNRKNVECCSWNISCKDFILQVLKDIKSQMRNAIFFMCDDEEEKEREEKIKHLISYIEENLK